MHLPTVIDRSDPSSVLTVILIVPLLAFAVALFFPALVAYSGLVFYRDDLTQKLSPELQAKLRAHAQASDAMTTQISKLDGLLANPAALSPQSIDGYLALRNDLSTRIEKSSAPVAPIPFYLNPQMLLWPVMYTSLGWLLTVFRPVTRGFRLRQKRTRWMILAILTYLMYEWPLWVRNFLVGNEGRIVFAYSNADIHLASFFAQEVMIFFWCVLLAALWIYWCEACKRSVASIGKAESDSFSYVVSSRTLDDLSSAFLGWQMSSVVLATGFLFVTNFYWELVGKYHDARYLLSAVMAHLLWALSWSVISLPLFVRWRAWVHARNIALARISNSDTRESAEAKSRTEVLSRVQPLTGIGVSISGLTAVTSFLLPLLHMIL